MNKYLEPIREKIKTNKRKIIKRASIGVAIIAGLGIAAFTTVYSIAKSNINYTVEDFLDDLVNNNLGEVIEKQKKESKIAANLDGSCGEKVYQYMINILRQQN